MAPSAPALHCRQIEESDTEAVASLLANGFRTHDRQFWLQAFAQLRRHATPAGLPKFGYLLESDGRVVGAVLLICSLVRDGDQDAPRCNLSSWYVDAAFSRLRAHAGIAGAAA
jgi:predicted N-acetyltransferase YhbS